MGVLIFIICCLIIAIIAIIKYFMKSKAIAIAKIFKSRFKYNNILIDLIEKIYNEKAVLEIIKQSCIETNKAIKSGHFIEKIKFEDHEVVIDQTNKKSTTPNSLGYWELELVENENMESGSFYIVTYGDNDKAIMRL